MQGLDLTAQQLSVSTFEYRMSLAGNMAVRDRHRAAVVTVHGTALAVAAVNQTVLWDYFRSKYEMTSRGPEVESYVSQVVSSQPASSSHWWCAARPAMIWMC